MPHESLRSGAALSVHVEEPESPIVETAGASTLESTFNIASDSDIVAVRQKGRSLAMQLGFSSMDATLVATAISELARNVVLYASPGKVVLRALDDLGRRGLLIEASDLGPGIPDVPRVLAGGYSTSQGLGLGLCGVRRLMDEFDITSGVGLGTTVTIKKWLR